MSKQQPDIQYPALLHFTKSSDVASGYDEYVVIATAWDDEFAESGYELSSYVELTDDVTSMPTDRVLTAE